MPATAMTNWIMVLSGWGVAFASIACAPVSPLGDSSAFRGVRSCMLKYSDDVSRRRGVACFVRAIVVASARGTQDGEMKEMQCSNCECFVTCPSGIKRGIRVEEQKRRADVFTSVFRRRTSWLQHSVMSP